MTKLNKSHHPKKAAMLAAYSQIGVVCPAADAAGISRHTHYKWMREDPEYAAAFAEAHAEACERLEQEARRRAVEGWEEPVFQMGEQIGTKRRYSDTLLIFLMKGNQPEKFGDKVETTHIGSPVQVYLPDNHRQPPADAGD